MIYFINFYDLLDYVSYQLEILLCDDNLEKYFFFLL